MGNACRFEYGLAWYHFSCNDCACHPKPYERKANMMRAHMARGVPSGLEDRPDGKPKWAATTPGGELMKLGSLESNDILT